MRLAIVLWIVTSSAMTRAEGALPAPVMLDATQTPALGLASEQIAERDFTRRARTVGVVTLDDTRTAHVPTRVRGRIAAYRVNFVGRKVRPGEPLISIDGQEVYAAERELVALLESPVWRSFEVRCSARQKVGVLADEKEPP